MEPRFSVNQPWHFGYFPSTYYATLDEETQSEINLTNVTLKELDSLHKLAISAPNTRRLDPVLLKRISKGYFIDEDISNPTLIPLAATYCKPFSEAELKKNTAEEIADLLGSIGVATRILPHPNENIAQEQSDVVMLLAGYSDKIIDTNLGWMSRRETDKITMEELRIVSGIIFGFPIADVFGHDMPSEANVHHPSLVHTFKPETWSEEWKKKIGYHGEQHLSQVYNDMLS